MYLCVKSKSLGGGARRVATLPEILSVYYKIATVNLRIMNPPRVQCVATKSAFVFTLLLLFSLISAQEPGKLLKML